MYFLSRFCLIWLAKINKSRSWLKVLKIKNSRPFQILKRFCLLENLTKISCRKTCKHNSVKIYPRAWPLLRSSDHISNEKYFSLSLKVKLMMEFIIVKGWRWDSPLHHLTSGPTVYASFEARQQPLVLVDSGFELRSSAWRAEESSFTKEVRTSSA